MLQNPHSLLPIAYRTAAQVLRSPVLAQEAGERAVHLLTMAVLQGCAPLQPKAWLRVVARRSACALLRSDWARTRGVDVSEIEDQPAPFECSAPSGLAWVREQLPELLTPRQRDALAAAMQCRTTRAAARTCGMQPRDFRRSLGSISRKARRLLEQAEGVGPWETPGAETGL